MRTNVVRGAFPPFSPLPVCLPQNAASEVTSYGCSELRGAQEISPSQFMALILPLDQLLVAVTLQLKSEVTLDTGIQGKHPASVLLRRKLLLLPGF